MQIQPKLLYPILIIILVAGTYLPSLNNDFVNWDDDVHVLHNPFIRKLDLPHLKDIFSSRICKTYIPLTTLSFALEYHFCKDNPFIYHLDNLLLHILVSVLVFFFGLCCGLSKKASLIAAVIFGIHPMHVESVAWITERKDVLYSLFYMLSLLTYCRYLAKVKKEGYSRGSQITFMGVVSLGILSILAKPMALSLPLIWWLLDWFSERPISRRAILEKIYGVLFFIPLAWMTYFYQARGVFSKPFEAILIWIWCFVFYIKKFFWPDTFALLFQRPSPLQWTDPAMILTVFFFFALFISVFFSRRRKIYVFGFLFYCLTIFFLLRFDTHGDANVVADRFMYMPSVGWCLWIGYGLTKIYQRVRHRGARVIFCILLGAVLLFLIHKTSRQIKVWQNGVTLWQHQLKTQPLIATDLAYTKLGKACLDSDTFDIHDPVMVAQVSEYFERAIRINPESDGSYSGLGELYLKKEDFRQAAVNFEKVLKLNPAHIGAYYNLGKVYYLQGKSQEGLENFSAAMRSEPDNVILFDEIVRFYQQYPRHKDDLRKFTERYGIEK